MAARKKSTPRKTAAAKRRKPEATAAKDILSVVRIGARRLETIGPDAPLWRVKPAELVTLLGERDGDIVRLKPPADVSFDHVDAVEQALRAAGAAVRLMPQERGDDPLPKSAREETAEAASLRPRDVVLELVEASTVADKDRLRALVESVLDAEGL